MKQQKKGEFIGSVIGLLCIYVVLGAIYRFVLGHNLISTIRLLAIQTLLLIIIAIPVVAVVWLLFFLMSKNKH